MSKELVNGVTLEIGEDYASINISLSIPVALSNEDKKKITEVNTDLGVVSFSENTSNLIRQAGEEMRKELLSEI
jgi:hypothetical protein